MEFCKVMSTAKRLCKSNIESCTYCPLNACGCLFLDLDKIKDFNKVEDVIVKWGKDHPEKTRRDVLCEKYPEALVGSDGYPIMCVRCLGYKPNEACNKLKCEQCWDKPVED